MPGTHLMIPGPIESEDDVLAALAEPTLPHYGPLFMPLFRETTQLLQQVFRTRHDVLMMPGPGTGALETAIGSMIPAGHSVLVISGGHFGRRAKAIAESYGQYAHAVDVPLGIPADPDAIRAILQHEVPIALREGRPFRAIFFVHHETSTGILNPMRALAAVAHEFDLAVIVDAVSSLGGTDVRVDEWGIDACVTVPNKALGAVPGLGLMSVSPRAWQMAAENPSRHGWYHDLNVWARVRAEWEVWHPYPTTLPTNVIAALNQTLKSVFAMGLDAWIDSHAQAASRVRTAMNAMGFPLYPDPAVAAPTISAFRTRADVNLVHMARTLISEHHIAISGGLDELYGQIFRVGHMGRARSPEVIDAFLVAVHTYLEAAGLPVLAA